jgi:hypothetical protein
MITSLGATAVRESSRTFELWFEPLAHNRPGFAFACDAAGHIDMDELSQRALANYMLARTLVGRDYSSPVIVRRVCDAEPDSTCRCVAAQ